MLRGMESPGKRLVWSSEPGLVLPWCSSEGPRVIAGRMVWEAYLGWGAWGAGEDPGGDVHLAAPLAWCQKTCSNGGQAAGSSGPFTTKESPT